MAPHLVPLVNIKFGYFFNQQMPYDRLINESLVDPHCLRNSHVEKKYVNKKLVSNPNFVECEKDR
jgi:hypothetical protein